MKPLHPLRPLKASSTDSPVAFLPPYVVDDIYDPLDPQMTFRKLQAETGGWASQHLNIPGWWKETRGEGVKVAVLDTGVDLDHPDLKFSVEAARSFVPNEDVSDGDGHGTHCCGVIAASENGVGFVGVAPKARLYVGKVLSNDGSGSFDWIVRGIRWAIDSKVDIISMSLGAPVHTPELHNAIHEAILKGIIVICAAGNEGYQGRATVGYPGKYGSVLSIGAHDKNGNVSGFSSTGGEVDLLGPGQDIWSCYKNGSYATLSGTSMATPCVAGVAALILSKHKKTPHSKTPIYSTEDMRNHLLTICTHPEYFDPRSGYGCLIPYNYKFRKLSEVV